MKKISLFEVRFSFPDGYIGIEYKNQKRYQTKNDWLLYEQPDWQGKTSAKHKYSCPDTDYVLGLKDVKPGIYILKADIGNTIGSKNKKFRIVQYNLVILARG